MPVYNIILHYETEIEAKDEEKAKEFFWNENIECSQTTPFSFIIDNIKVEERK